MVKGKERSKKYDRILRLLEPRVRQMTPGSKLPPIRDMMKEFGVSQSPLDNALRILEGKKLIRKIIGSGIYADSGPPRRNTLTVGAVFPDLSDRFFSMTLSGLQSGLSGRGYSAIVAGSSGELEKEIEATRAMGQKIDGLALLPSTRHFMSPEYLDYFREFREKNPIPVVCSNIPLPGIQSAYVDISGDALSRTVAALLAKKPDSGLVFFGNMGSYAAAGRYNSVMDTLRGAGFDARGLLCLDALPGMDIKAALSGMLEKFRGKSLILVNAFPPFLPALAVFMAGSGLRTPEEIIPVSVAEEDYKSHISMPLIAVVKPASELGRTMAAKLADLIASPTPRGAAPERVMLEMRVEAAPALAGFLDN